MSEIQVIDQVLAIVLFMAEYFEKELSDEIINGYVVLLNDIPLGKLQRAAAEWLSAGKPFMPRISELRTLALTESYLTPGEAWREVLEKIAERGRYGKPVFSDALIGEAVSQLGWLALCTSRTPDADRAHFFRTYEQLLRRQNTLQITPEFLTNGSASALLGSGE
jgi:hypothetical protein